MLSVPASLPAWRSSLGQSRRPSCALSLPPGGTGLWTIVAESAVWRAAQLGFAVDVLRCGTMRGQVEEIAKWVEDRCGTVVLCPFPSLRDAVVGNALLEVVHDARTKRMPVVLLDQPIDVNYAQRAETGTCLIVSDESRAGLLAAEYFGGRLEAGSEIVHLRGMGNPRLDRAFRAGLARFPRIGIGTEDDFARSRSTARELVRVVAREPQIRGVFAQADELALGAADALRELGRDDVLVLGHGGLPLALLAVAEGALAGTISRLPSRFGAVVAETAKRLLQGEKVPALVRTDVQLVTAANVQAALQESASPLLSSVPSADGRARRAEALDRQVALVERALQFIEGHLAEPIGVKEIATSLAVSRSYLHRLFVDRLSRTPSEVITAMRVERSKEYLVSTSMAVLDVGAAVGFSPRYFFEVFRSRTGMTPGQFASRFRSALVDSVGDES